MGIKQLMNIINEKAPSAVRRLPIDSFAGHIVACDASMTMYQFLYATQYNKASTGAVFSDESGDPTSHLLGIFNRTIQLLENGIKPI